MPDINSLPPSRSPSLRTRSFNGQPAQHSHQQSQNQPLATPQHSSPLLRGSPLLDRRRSSNVAAWSLNEGPPSPHHQRAPSLGELHQELESEQEAQVVSNAGRLRRLTQNRLLAMIRTQQAQIQQLQHAGGSEAPAPELPSPAVSISRQSSSAQRRQGSGLLQRHDSHDSHSHSHSHSHSPQSTIGRDDAAHWHAEAEMVQRENQLLKLRIAELERDVRARDRARQGQGQAGQAAQTDERGNNGSPAAA